MSVDHFLQYILVDLHLFNSLILPDVIWFNKNISNNCKFNMLKKYKYQFYFYHCKNILHIDV